MAKTEIITRTYNRLEYTSLCIRSVSEFAGTNDYRHIIIEQNSTDGTVKWLKSLLIEKYYKLFVKFNQRNTGDAGGMRDGFKILSDDCEYVMQIDNDIRILTPDFLRILVELMDSDKNIGAVMLYRERVKNRIFTKNIFKFSDQEFGFCEGVVACFIMRRDLVQGFNIWFENERIGWCTAISGAMAKSGFKTLKSISLKCEHIDGWQDGAVLQFSKYSKLFGTRVGGSNYKDFKY